jgi:hypothetical protein
LLFQFLSAWTVPGFPAGVDPAKKEAYLPDIIFAEKFGMDKIAFAKLPDWKKESKKKELKLF